MEKKALQLASVASMIDLFNTENINILRSLGYSVDVATNFEDGSITSQERVNEYRKELKEQGIGTYQIPIPRSLKRVKDIIISYKMVKKLVNKNHYRIVHCHSPIGGVICRLACRKARKSGTKVIYTAHGFHFFKGASKASWMIYYPIEKWMSRYTDILITINHEDYQRAKKRFYAKKTVYVPGVGIDIEQFNSGFLEKISTTRTRLESKYGLDKESILFLSVGELNKNKNHAVVIRALARMDNRNLHYFIAGQGKLKDELIQLASQLGISGQVHLLGYRIDVPDLMHAADVYLLPSIREGLNVSLMEAMASGLPCLCSNIRGNKELITKEAGGYLVDALDVGAWQKAISKVLNMGKEFGNRNTERISRDFSKFKVQNMMKKIYMQC